MNRETYISNGLRFFDGIHVAGTTFHRPASEEPTDIKSRSDEEKGFWNFQSTYNGDELKLIREPDNKYDENAIALYWEGDCVGYIPKDIAIVLATIIDKNKLDLYSEVMYNAHLHDKEKIGLIIRLGVPDKFVNEDLLTAYSRHDARWKARKEN